MPHAAQISVHDRHGTGESTIAISGLAIMWTLAAANYLLSSGLLGTGTSTVSNKIVRRQHLLPVDSTTQRNSFFDHVADYCTHDWDGDGAVAISSDDIASARSLLDALAATDPEIVAGSDGSICMEWIRHSPMGEKKIYVDIGPNGKVLTFARFGESSPIEKHFDQYGPDVIDHLRVLFSIYLA